MARDYAGEMSYYQDQLTKKGITKAQLDMSRYVGLTADELQSIVDHPQSFMRPSSNDILEFLKSIDTQVPEGFTKEKYVSTINWYSYLTHVDTPTERAIFDFISKYDIDEVFALYHRVEHEYHETYHGVRCYGRHRFWDDRAHEDKTFRAFSSIAEESIDPDTFHEEHFQKMLMEAYNKQFA